MPLFIVLPAIPVLVKATLAISVTATAAVIGTQKVIRKVCEKFVNGEDK